MCKIRCHSLALLALLVLFAPAVVCHAETSAAYVSRTQYLDLMESAVQAYGDARLTNYLADVARAGVQEHGFPRLAANLAVLMANGRCREHRATLQRMMDLCCRDAAKGKMPPKSGGNEFSIKELVLGLTELERAQTYPKGVTDRWRQMLSSVVAENSYTTGRLKVGGKSARNWVVFAAASEQARLAHGMGGDKAFVEKYVADQLRWFDANGMYKDPNQPAVYDFVTRLQFALILHDGYRGASYAKLTELMERSAEPTLKMLSAAGEIPYGGRSNQFLHNHTFYAALCEWYAAEDAQKGNALRAARFRAAAAKAVAALTPYLACSPRIHVKNRYPRSANAGVFSPVGDIGCERYAYFEKYMVTMGSWAMLGWLFARDDVTPSVALPPEPPAQVFVTTPDFHWALLRAGDYFAQFDYNADLHYDCDGVGRVQRAGAPAMLCLSTPCARKPAYRIETPNDAPLALVPRTAETIRFVDACVQGEKAVLRAQAGNLDWHVALSRDGLVSTLTGADALAFTVPAFDFDGCDATKIVATERTLTVAYQGWRCMYETNGAFVDTKRSACNRNGRYRRFEAHGQNTLTVTIKIERNLQ